MKTIKTFKEKALLFLNKKLKYSHSPNDSKDTQNYKDGWNDCVDQIKSNLECIREPKSMYWWPIQHFGIKEGKLFLVSDTKNHAYAVMDEWRILVFGSDHFDMVPTHAMHIILPK